MLEKIVIPRELEEKRMPISRPRLAIVRSVNPVPILEIAYSPRIWSQITDDSSRAKANWYPPMADNAYWLLAVSPVEQAPLGWGAFLPKTGVTAETHFAFLPEVWGEQAQNAFRDMLRWVQVNTSFRRLVGEIPRSNRLALHFARRAGFKVYALNERSISRKGLIEDQYCLALNLF